MFTVIFHILWHTRIISAAYHNCQTFCCFNDDTFSELVINNTFQEFQQSEKIMKMWCWRRIEKIKWSEKVTNEQELERIGGEEDTSK